MMHNKTADGAVTDYLNSLLLDTQLGSSENRSSEPVLRFAHVEPGQELAVLWQGPLTEPQQLYRDFMLLSLCRSVSGRRLKHTMLKSLTRISH